MAIIRALSLELLRIGFLKPALAVGSERQYEKDGGFKLRLPKITTLRLPGPRAEVRNGVKTGPAALGS